MSQNEHTLLETILKLHTNGRFVLGIDGLSRSGKTTLVEGLQQVFVNSGKNVRVFHIDDHIVERGKRYNTGHESWYEYYHLQWDVNHLADQLFSRVRQSSEITLPFYSEELDAHIQKTAGIPTECVVLIEGVFLQRQEWRSYFDYIVYLDCPRETRFLRESEQTQKKIEKFQERYWKAEEYYINRVQPHRHADLVLGS